LVDTLFLAGVGGYKVTVGSLVMIMVLALISSVGDSVAAAAVAQSEGKLDEEKFSR